jgi:hypothetical protein
MLFGTQFVWVTNCYAIWFILSYEGANPAILCLQMQLMCWDMDIVHQNNIHMTNEDYGSRLGVGVCFDTQFKVTLTSAEVFALASRLPSTYQCTRRTCPIIVDHE